MSDARRPPEPWSQPVTAFAGAIDALCRANVEAIVTSWWRDPETNANVGGQEASLHLQGLAADFDLPGASRADLERLARQALSLGLSVILYWSAAKSYVHVQARPLLGGARFLAKA